MKYFRLPIFDADQADLEPRYQKAVEEVVAAIQSAPTYWDIVRKRKVVEQLKNTKVRKWRAQDHRILFRIERTNNGENYIVLFRALTHGEYDEILLRTHTLDNELDQAKGKSDFSSFLKEMERTPSISLSSIPYNYIGLRHPVALLSLPRGGRIVEETTNWVEDVLAPIAGTDDLLARLKRPTSDKRELNKLATLGTLIIDSPESGIVSRHDLDTSILSSGDRMLIEKLNVGDDVSTSTIRRTYPMPSGPDSLANWIKIARSSGAHTDPFLKLDDGQEEFLRRFQLHGGLPACIDGPGGSGKTTILLSLLRGVLQNKDQYPGDLSLRIITASESLTQDLRAALENHLELLDGYNIEDSRNVAKEICATVDQYLLSLLPSETRELFSDIRLKVTWPDFSKWYRYSIRHHQLSATAHEAWAAIRVQICGATDGREDPNYEESRPAFNSHILNWFSSLDETKRFGLSSDLLAECLQIFGSYRDWKRSEGRWDESDLTQRVLEHLASDEGISKSTDLLIVDEAQDLSPDTLRAIIRSSACVNFQLENLIKSSKDIETIAMPLVFAADDMQSINPSGFKWDAFRTIFFEETQLILNSTEGVKIETRPLLTNYRMKEKVAEVAHSLRRWMNPSVTEVLPETKRHGGFSSPVDASNKSEVIDYLRLASRVIVPSLDRYIDSKEMISDLGKKYPILAEAFGNDFGKVVSAIEMKGKECKTAVLLDFASYLKDAKPGLETTYARQIAYVAASRARDNVLWLETDVKSRDWMWNLTDDTSSPAQYLPKAEPVSGLDKVSLASSTTEVLNDAHNSLLDALLGTEEDDATRASYAATARALFAEVSEVKLSNTSHQVSRYFEGDRAALNLAEVDIEYIEILLDLVHHDGIWSAFRDADVLGLPSDFYIGSLVYAYKQRNIEAVFQAAQNVSRTSTDLETGVREEAKNALRGIAQFAEEEVEKYWTDGRKLPFEISASLSIEVIEKLDVAVVGNESILKVLFALSIGKRTEALRYLTRLSKVDKKRKRLEALLIRTQTGIYWLEDEAFPRLEFSKKLSDMEIEGKFMEICIGVISSPEVLVKFIDDNQEIVPKLSTSQASRLIAEAMKMLEKAI